MNIGSLIDGLETFLIGVTVVFTTLVLLIALIVILSKVIGRIDNLAKKPVKKPTPAVAPSIAPVQETKTDDLELVAVITAAIAASMGTTTDTLQVRSLRCITKNTPFK